MLNKIKFFVLASIFTAIPVAGQTTAPAANATIWNALAAASMDPAKSARADNVSIVRDAVHITLVDGTIQLTNSVNGGVFGAVFHGNGRVEANPPNRMEAHQLLLFTKQPKLNMAFTDATFSFTDGFAEEIAKQVKWQANGPGGDELYANRQREREDVGAEYLPRLFKSVMSPDRKRTAYFLADLKTKEKGWVEIRYDAMQPEEIGIGRWADVGGYKLHDVWMNFPADGRDFRHAYDDPAARQDFLIPEYQITTHLADNAELTATAKVTVQPRYAGEQILLFSLDSNLRVSAVKDAQGRTMEFFQPRERKDRSQSYGDYVAVALKEPTQTNRNEVLEFQYGGKHVVVKVGGGNYFCQSFGWYPAAFTNELGVDEFAFRSKFDLTFRNPKRYSLVATGNKVSSTVEGKELITTWSTDTPIAAAGFAFGDYKITTEKVGDVEVQVYANRQPDDLLQAIQSHFDNPLGDLAGGPEGSHITGSAVGTFSAAALTKTIGIETANTLRVFQIILARTRTSSWR